MIEEQLHYSTLITLRTLQSQDVWVVGVPFHYHTLAVLEQRRSTVSDFNDPRIVFKEHQGMIWIDDYQAKIDAVLLNAKKRAAELNEQTRNNLEQAAGEYA